jgi:murein DD-endopeptidase MepM/ murein hydrolase activator NlpD
MATKSGSGLLLVLAALAAIAYTQHEPAAGSPPADSTPAGSGRYVKPVDGTLTSGFGSRWGTTHYGIDIAAPEGTPIRAVTTATVIEAGPATGFGLWMRLAHPDGTVTVYGHMHTITRPAGAHVAPGEQIATVGARGNATGAHLHFEVWPHGDRTHRINPVPWLAARGVTY